MYRLERAASSQHQHKLSGRDPGAWIANQPRFTNDNLIGSVWLDPSQTPLQPGLNLATNSIGSISLANSTMETFVQNVGTNCFTCHNTITGVNPKVKKYSDKNIAVSLQ